MRNNYMKSSILSAMLFVALGVSGNQTELKTYKPKHVKNISYLSKASNDEYRNEMSYLDLYLPEGAKDFPTLIYFHGGGLISGNRSGPIRLAKLGVAVAIVEYRLYPRCKHPEYIEDCAAATAWIFKNIKKYGGNIDKIFIGGYSAGAYLAGMIAMDKKYLSANGINADKLAGVLMQSAQCITHFRVRKQLGYKARQGVCDENSPMYHIRKTPFPILLQCANKDFPSRQKENQLFESMMLCYAAQPRKLIEYREYSGTHGTLQRNSDFKRDTEIFVLKNSGLPHPPPDPKAVTVYSRSCLGKNFLDVSGLKQSNIKMEVALNGKTVQIPESGVIPLNQAFPQEITVSNDYGVKKIAPVKEYHLQDGKKNALNAPGGVRFWTENGKIFFELDKSKKKPKIPPNHKYYYAGGIDILVDRTPFRKLSEVFTLDKALNAKRYHFFFVQKSNGKSFIVKCMSDNNADITRESQAKSTSRLKPDGYSMLVSIPLSELSPLNQEKVIGLNILVNDYTTGKKQVFNLSGKEPHSFYQRLDYPLFELDAFTKLK